MRTKKYRIVLLSICLLVCLWLPPLAAAVEAPPPGLPTPPHGQTQAAEAPPPGQAKAAETIGEQGGYIHPFVGLTELYNDNVFAVKTGKQSDYETIVSPGLWLAYPRLKERLFDVETSLVTPGAIPLTTFFTPSERRYQTYVLYQGDFERYDKTTHLNSDNHKIDGMLEYNFSSGLSIDMRDEYVKNHTILGIGASATEDRYESNLFNTVLSYQVTDKILLRADYTNYPITFASSTNAFRNRTDNGVDAYVFYKVMPRTSLFAEYDFIDSRYEKNILVNSDEHHVLLGFRHEITAKTLMSFKAGVDIKDFATSALGSTTHFICEAQLQHRFTPKSFITLTYGRRTNETDLSAAGYVVEDSVNINYAYRMTDKLTGGLSAWFANDQYEGTPTTEGGQTRLRKDTYYRVGPLVQYRFKEWLNAALQYNYTKRNSDFSDFGYSNNTVMLLIKATL